MAFEVRLNKDFFNIPASVIVFGRGDKAVAIDGYTKRRILESANHAKVFQAALNNLTSGRRRKEKVVFKGEFELADTVLVPSYVCLDFREAKVKATPGLNKRMFGNADEANGNEEIEIIGGLFDCNGANQTDNTEAFLFRRVSNVVFRGCTFINPYNTFIHITHPVDEDPHSIVNFNDRIEDCVFHGDGQVVDADLVLMSSMEGGGFFKNYLVKCNLTGLGGGNQKGVAYIGNFVYGAKYPIKIESPDGCIVAYNTIIKAQGLAAIMLTSLEHTYGAGSGYPYPKKCIVEGNFIYDPENDGIYISGNREDFYAEGNIVIGNVIIKETNAGSGNGITLFDYVIDTIIAKNYVKGFANAVRSNVGASYLRDIIIAGNRFTGNNWGVVLEGDDNILVVNNDLRGNSNGALLHTSGPHNIIRNNIGYITLNGGTAVFSGDGTTTQFKVKHGLAKAPKTVIATPLSPDAKDFSYAEADDTYIYFNFSTAPPSGTDNVKLAWYAEV